MLNNEDRNWGSGRALAQHVQGPGLNPSITTFPSPPSKKVGSAYLTHIQKGNS
jgi:hypothetical protein